MNANFNIKSFLYRNVAILVIVMLAFAAMPVTRAYAAACTFTSNGNGNWTTAGTWTASGGGCSNYPGQTFAGDTVIISSGNTVTLNTSPAQSIASLTFNAAGGGNNAVNFNNGMTLNVTGAVNMTNVPTGNRTTTLAVGTGTLNAGSISIAGSPINNRDVILSVSSGTIHTTGDITFSGTAAQAQLTVTNTAATLTVDGNFSGGGTFTLANPTNMSLGGNYGFTGTLSNTNRLNLTVNGAGDQTVTGTVTFRTLTVNKASGTLFLTTTPTLSNGQTFTNGDIAYNGVAQNVLSGVYPDSLTLSGSGVKSIPAGTSVTGNLSIAPTGTATASIAAGQNLNVGNLTLGGLGRIDGTWGGTGSGATNINTTYFAATTGYLTVGTDTRTAASVTTWPTATGITSGQALSASTLSGGVAPTAGSFAFTTPATIPPVGTYSASVTFTPTDATSYTSVVGAVNVIVAPLATGTTYYVNNTNASCSNAGTGLTIAQPFCTIGRGVTAAVAGDTVRVLAGTYAETVTMVRSGSAGSPITFSADSGVTVTGAASHGFRISGWNYITIDGFNVTNTVGRGIYVSTSDHIVISNNHISLSGSPVSGSTQAGIQIDATTNSSISGNTTDHNSSYGIYLLGGSSGNTISDNISFANAQQYQRVATGINIFASNNNTIIHNITYANEDSGIQVYTGSTGNFVIGNLSYGNADHGIDFLNSQNNAIVGNTVQGNYTSGINVEGTSTGVTIANNIAVDNGIAIVGSGQPGNIRVDANSTAGSTSNYNIVFLSGVGTSQIQWNGTNYATLAAFKTAFPTQEVNGLEADPLFIAPVTPAVRPNGGNGGLPAVNVGDYHIASTSPAIDSANSNAPGEPLLDIDGNARIDTPIADTGAGVRTYDDRGAYESQTGTGGTLPTVTTEAVTSIGTTTATGNGTVANLGTPNPYQHGVVWDTAANPTVTLSTKTTQGAVAATGAFTSNITGLTPGTLYHVRAYATNTTGTAYGADVSFAVTSTTVGTSGSPSIYGSPVTFTATVLPATATGTVTFYDGATALGTGTLSAGTATISISTLSVDGSPHSITATYAGSGIYGPSTSSLISQVITPATLTYTADPVTRAYGVANPAFTGTVTGFISPDTEASATTGTLTFTSTATIASDVGSYAITGSGLTANNGNYTFVQAAGNATALTITPATPTASVTNSPVIYNGSVQTATVACLGGGTATLVPGTGTGTNVGSYPATVDCAASLNYAAASGLSAGDFVINQATPTASITNSPVIYNGSVQTATVACSGGGAATLASGGTGTNAGSYPATVDCAASLNYTAASGLSAGNFVIDPATPTASVTNSPVIYNGSVQTATVACSGGGAATLASGGTGTNAGSYPATVDCAASANYAAASGLSAGDFVINQATPTASVTNSPVTYNGSVQTATVACSGGGAATLASGGTGTNAGSYPATVDCAASLNYTAASGLSAGDFVINQATPTASITNSPAVFTGFVQTATVVCSGGGTATLVPGTGTGTAVGSYPATVDCAASANYVAASGLSAGDFVIVNSTQSITVTNSAPATASNGSTFNVAATASSGLTVSITATGVCTVVDNGNGTADITMTSGTGTCSVFYDQAGDGNYSAATQVQEDVTATEGPAFTSANNTAFDVTFFGTFTITAVGNPQTMTISLAGALPSGVSFVDNGDGSAVLSGTPALGTNGTYPLSLTAANGVAPNGTQNFTLTVKSGPIIGANGINSMPDTGDGSIGENESIIDTLGITQLTVEFSQDVYDPAGDTDQDDVTNPANYVLVRSTSTTFATVSCADGVKTPDVQISVDAVAYNNGGGAGPFVSTLSINGGFPLNVVGFYRLYVCGTTSIVDANNTSLVLAGNGTTPGTDFQRNFRIAMVAAGGGGGGGDNSSSSSTVVTNGFLIPVTGFAPDRVTTLPAQPAEAAYTSLGQMTIEIPTLGVKFPIVGAKISNKTWNLTWLKDSVAYLEGSAYPTTAGNTVLTAHVQDANKNLGPFSDIKGMTVGQNIYIHVNGQTYVYQVQESRKISPTGITTMFKHEEDSWITLVTCEDFNAKTGLYSTRRMVRAVLISVIPAVK